MNIIRGIGEIVLERDTAIRERDAAQRAFEAARDTAREHAAAAMEARAAAVQARKEAAAARALFVATFESGATIDIYAIITDARRDAAEQMRDRAAAHLRRIGNAKGRDMYRSYDAETLLDDAADEVATLPLEERA